MHGLNRIGGIRAACLLSCSLFILTLATSARADEIYTYTGNSFSSCSGACSGSLSGSFTLAQVLPDSSTISVQFPNTPGYTNVLSWSFTDGNFTWNPQDSPAGFTATFTTDSNGQIIQWTLNGGTATVGSNTFQWSSSNVGCAIHMLTCVDSSTEDTTIFAKSFTPGVWTKTPLPEPSSLLLLSLGMIALVTVSGRRLFASN
jgi:PEP-CTERM motif